jgi:hypothetical protein
MQRLHVELFFGLDADGVPSWSPRRFGDGECVVPIVFWALANGRTLSGVNNRTR